MLNKHMSKLTINAALIHKNNYYFLMSDNCLYNNQGIVQISVKSAKVSGNSIKLENFNGYKYKLLTEKHFNAQCKITDLPFEIIDIIFNQLQLTDQINFRSTTKKFSTIPLTNFWNLTGSFKITDAIIKQNPFIRKLDLSGNHQISCVQNLIHLRKLNIINSKIKNLSNLPNLRLVVLNNDKIKIDNMLNISDSSKITVITMGNYTIIRIHNGEKIFTNISVFNDDNIEIKLKRYGLIYRTQSSLRNEQFFHDNRIGLNPVTQILARGIRVKSLKVDKIKSKNHHDHDNNTIQPKKSKNHHDHEIIRHRKEKTQKSFKKSRR